MPDLNGLDVNQQARDLDMAYRDTYVLAKVKGGLNKAIFVKKFQPNGKDIIVTYIPNDKLQRGYGGDMELLSNIELDDKLPQSGLVQYGLAVSYVARSIDRQFKRGLCSDNTVVVRVLGRDHHNGSAIQHFFNTRQYVSMQEKIRDAKEGMFACGLLTDELAVGSYGGTDVLAMAWNDKVIGWIPKGSERLLLMKEFYWLQPKIVDHCEISEVI